MDDNVAFTTGVYSRYIVGWRVFKSMKTDFKASVGSVGDSYYNAMAESINSLYKVEVIHKDEPRHGLVSYGWTSSTIEDMPPAEYELMYYQNSELRKAS